MSKVENLKFEEGILNSIEVPKGPRTCTYTNFSINKNWQLVSKNGGGGIYLAQGAPSPLVDVFLGGRGYVVVEFVMREISAF